MLNDKEFFEESLITNLYYLRTLREYCTRIQVSFPIKYDELIKRSEELAKRCDEIGNRLMNYADSNIPDNVLKSDIIVTKYTLEAELLTEKLFGIDVDTSITEKELAIKPGSTTPTKEMVQAMEEINTEIIELANEFIEFSSRLIQSIKNQEIFAFYYNSLNDYIIEEMKIYVSTLERLNQKDKINPSYVIDNEYWYNAFLFGISRFIRGEIDPVYEDIFNEANNFVNEYRNIIIEYETMIITPITQKNMTLNSLELARRFKTFVEKCIEKLLKKELYFISAPITKDNALTAINYFIYNLEKTEKTTLESQ